MRGKRYTEEQILREVESGTSVVEVCRQYNVAEATVYCWRQKYKGLEESQLKRLKELETENTRIFWPKGRQLHKIYAKAVSIKQI